MTLTNPSRACGSPGFALAFVLLIGCSSSEDAPVDACTKAPSSCPAPAPTYADVAPIFSAKCAPCHSATGVVPTKPLDAYDAVFRVRITALSQLQGCRMPPDGSPPLTADERQKLLSWFVCGAPK